MLKAIAALKFVQLAKKYDRILRQHRRKMVSACSSLNNNKFAV
jgi:hypothetical protein